MYITWKDLKKYLLFALFFLWLILFFHLFYLYVRQQALSIPVKSGILLEGVISEKIINPFPYIATNYYSRYIQSLLFKSCLDDFGKPLLCNVFTKDKKTFVITLTGDNYWSDGRKITLDDIYFTYNDIIKNNSLNLENPIPNTITKITKTSTGVSITFSDSTVNNWVFFKYPILPKHILMGADKNYYVLDYIKNFVNSTCVKIDPVSDFTTKIVLDYTNCENVYFNKYQFNRVGNFAELKKYLTGNATIDIFNGYENIAPEKFKKFDISLSSRYALFWNVLKQTNPIFKAYLSKIIIEKLKTNEVVNNHLKFNGYGLFVLPAVSNLSKEELKKLLTETLIQEKKIKYRESLKKVSSNYIVYTGSYKKYWISTLKDKVIIKGILPEGYLKIGISANSGYIYVLKSYIPFSKEFKYVLSKKFKNLQKGLNTYTIYGFSGNNFIKLDTIIVFYKNIVYPKFEVKVPSFTLVYLNKGFNSILGNAVDNILKEIYPGKVISQSTDLTGYKKILEKKQYDLVIGNVNFLGKDISNIFLSKNPLFNPSNFVNSTFANLIRENLLASIKEKKKIFEQLDKIYKQTLPVVILGNAKMGLYVAKKYDVPNLDYSYFANRKKMLENIIITRIKKPVLSEISVKGFIDFLKSNLKQ